MGQKTPRRMTSARIPAAGGEFELFLYCDEDSGKEHLALVLGEVAHREKVLVRVHSECFTGDVLGSKRCDCGQQLSRGEKWSEYRSGGPDEFQSFASNCLLARRLVERGVRFINIYHATWDHHEDMDNRLGFNCTRCGSKRTKFSIVSETTDGPLLRPFPSAPH